MNKLSLKIKMVDEQLGDAEKKVASYVLDCPESLIPMSISQVAKACHVSEATVTRFSKKAGFDGFQQLKLFIASEIGIPPINSDILDSDTVVTIFNKICNEIYCSLEKTKTSINNAALQNVCRLITPDKKILIFGLGNSASIATDFAHKLMRIGFNAIAYTDNHIQSIASAQSNSSTIAIGISHSGSSKDIVEAMKLCKQNQATTIGITNYGKSPIYRVCEYVLTTVSDETNYTILGLNSRIAQLAIIDTIYSYLVCHIPGAKDAIQKTESALHSKKY